MMNNGAFRNITAIFKRELVSYFESPVAYVFLIVFLLLTNFLAFFVGRYYEIGQADIRMYFIWFPWVFLILVPAAAMRLWSEERRAGTIETLLTLPITLAQAILGKFLAAWAFLAIAVLATFPVVLTTLYLGEPDMGVVVGGYVGVLFLAAVYLSVGMLTSAMTRNQVISFVVAVVICLFLLLAGWPPVTQLLSRWAPQWLIDAVAAFGFMPYYESIQRGVLDVRDIVYAVSMVAFMLYTTHIVIQNRKAA